MTTVPWHEGDVIRKLRAVYGWHLEDLADKSGVATSVIHRLELGITKEAKRETLRKLATAFGWTAHQLLEAIPVHPIRVSSEVIEASRAAKAAEREIKRHQLRRRNKAIR